MQRNVTDDFSHDMHLPDSFYFDICVFQAGTFGLKTQEAAELHECCGQSSRPQLARAQKVARWIQGLLCAGSPGCQDSEFDLLCFQCLNFLLQRTTLLTLDNDSIFYAPQVPGSQPFLFSPLSE